MKVQLRYEQRRAEHTVSLPSPLDSWALAQRAAQLRRWLASLETRPTGRPRVQLFGYHVGRLQLPESGSHTSDRDTRAGMEWQAWGDRPVMVAEGVPFADARALGRMIKHELDDEGNLAGPPEFEAYDSTFTIGRLIWPLAGPPSGDVRSVALPSSATAVSVAS